MIYLSRFELQYRKHTKEIPELMSVNKTHKVTLRSVPVTTIAVRKQYVLNTALSYRAC
jgi:hypothetical protein